jgi:uncharacterized protein CbrC (UPF0167 family)
LHYYILDEHYCPWCISHGEAELNHNTEFSSDEELREAEVPDAIIFTVTRCTPAYDCFQGARWLGCCGDACEYLGHATISDLQLLTESQWTRLGWGDEWQALLASNDVHYGDAGFYKFRCRHCGTLKYRCDCG